MGGVGTCTHETAHCWNHWQSGAMTTGSSPSPPVTTAPGRTPRPELQTQAQPRSTRPLRRLPQQTPNQGLQHRTVTNLSKGRHCGQFPLSTKSSRAPAPLFHAQIGNSGIIQMLLLFVLATSICRRQLNSFDAQGPPKPLHVLLSSLHSQNSSHNSFPTAG